MTFRQEDHDCERSIRAEKRARIGTDVGRLLLLVLVSVLTACGGEEASENLGASVDAQAAAGTAKPTTGYNTDTVRLSSIPQSITLGGTVVPRNPITLSAQAPGRVVYLVGVEGTAVAAGQLLVGLDDEDLIAKRRAAWAGMNKSMASLQNSQVQLDRQIWTGNGPAKGGMGIPSMFDKFFTGPGAGMMGYGNQGFDRYADINMARSDVEVAQAATVQAQAAVDELDAKLRDKKAISPGNAIILEKYIEIGDTVQPGMPLVKIADAYNLQVKVELPTRLLPGLGEGMNIPVVADNINGRIVAVLEQIYPSANPAQHTVTIKLGLPMGVPVAPGMYVSVLMPDFSATSPALPVIPNTAIVWRGGQASVFIVGADSHTQLRLVRLGDNLGNSTVVLSGLWQGERFLVAPPPVMRSGVPISAARDRFMHDAQSNNTESPQRSLRLNPVVTRLVLDPWADAMALPDSSLGTKLNG